jgi:hypothetical protein
METETEERFNEAETLEVNKRDMNKEAIEKAAKEAEEHEKIRLERAAKKGQLKQ